MNGTTLALAVAALLLGAAIGYLLAAVGSRRTGYELRAAAARSEGLEAKLDTLTEEHSSLVGEAAVLREKLQQAEKSREEVQQSIAESTKALELAVARKMQEYIETLAKGATETFAERAEISFNRLVGPMDEELKRLDQVLDGMKTSQAEQLGGLGQALSDLVKTHIPELRTQTANLAQALSAPSVRGSWGEVQLKRVIELAGMTNYCDFDEQTSFSDDRGIARPDVVVHLPGGREIVIDAKVPLEAYLRLNKAADERERTEARAAHARQLESMIKDLASRNYGSRLKNSLDFVVLFVPGESMLADALAEKPALFEEAFAKSVVVASPSTLLPLLKAVAYGWRSEALERNAAKIAEIGQELYKRMTTFRGHLDRVGSGLSQAVTAFNAGVGSYEGRIVPQARRLLEHGIEGSEEELRAPREVGGLPRQVEQG